MKVSPSIRKRCAKCKIVKRNRRLYVICETQSTNSDRDNELWQELKVLTSRATSGSKLD